MDLLVALLQQLLQSQNLLILDLQDQHHVFHCLRFLRGGRHPIHKREACLALRGF